MENWKIEKVPVTVHLTAEAARILYAYAGERNRGWFLSQLLVAQRRRDDEEGERLMREAEEAALRAKAAQEAVRRAQAARPSGSSKRKKR